MLVAPDFRGMGCAEVSTHLQVRPRQFLCHIRNVSVVLHPGRFR